MNKIQKIGVSCFLFNKDKVLILRRSEKESFLPGFYELSGGKVEFGESAEEAVIREMKEETGLSIKVIKPYSTFSYVSNDGERHTIDIQFVANLSGNSEVVLSQAHDDYKWIDSAEIKNLKISDQMKEAILKGFKESNN
jgi:8-oxo-dGTP diphosphatase